MLLLDVNVVLAAARPDHPRHTEVRPWFDGMLGGRETFGVPMTVWASFLRLVTSRRVFAVPSTPEEAFAFVDAVRAQPLHRPAEPGGAHVEVLRRLCREAEAAGDLVPDAVLAAIAVERACTVATLGRDSARFAEVEHVRPATRS